MNEIPFHMAIKTCVYASMNAAERANSDDAAEAAHYAEAARNLVETMATMFHYNIQ